MGSHPEHENDPEQEHPEQNIIDRPGKTCRSHQRDRDDQHDQCDQHVKNTFQDHRRENIKRTASDQPAHDHRAADLTQPQRQQVQQIPFRDGEKTIQDGWFIIQDHPPGHPAAEKGNRLQRKKDQEKLHGTIFQRFREHAPVDKINQNTDDHRRADDPRQHLFPDIILHYFP